MIKKMTGLFVLAICSFVSHSQNLTITDTELQPLSDVQLFSDDNKISAISNNAGIVDVSKFKNCASITILHNGFATVVTSYKTLETKKFRIYLYEKTETLNAVVVAANKFDEKAKYVAQQVQTLNKKELSFVNQQTSADVLQASGNVLVQKSQQGGGSPIIRGFETNKVLIVIDGVRMNNAIYRGGHLQNVVTLDNAAMEKVEVVFGPGSVIYGSDALGGVMNFYTKNPMLSDTDSVLVKANAYVRYNSVNQGQTYHVDLSLGKKRFGSFTSFTFSDFGDLTQGNNRNPFYGDWGKRSWYVERIDGKDSTISNSNDNVQVGSAYSQYDLLQKFIYKQNEKVQHTLNFQYSTSSNVPRYDRLTQVRNGNPRYAEWYYGPQNRLLASYALELSRKTALYDNARITAAYQNIEESRYDRSFNNVNLNQRIEQLDIFSLNADFSKRWGKNELYYGADAWLNNVNSTASKLNIDTDVSSSLDTRYPDGGSTMSNVAAYASHIFKINERLTLNDGIRASYVSLNSKFNDKSFFPFPFNTVTQNNMAVNGNVGIIYRPTSDWKVSLLASSGFRAPNVDDLSKVFESTPGNIIVPNPSLKPEYTYNLDLGITRSFNDKITVSATGFYTWYSNAITTLPSTFNGRDSLFFDGRNSKVYMSNNANSAYIYGVNFNVNAAITSNFSINHSTNYTYGRLTAEGTEVPLDHIAPVFGKTGFVYQQLKFRGEFFAMYNGAKKTADYNPFGEDNQAFSADPINGYMPAWMTLNIRTGYQINKTLQVLFAVENITDLNYRVFASNISAAGRNFVFTLKGTL